MSNYPPKHHQDKDLDHLLEVIKTYPLATVISVKNNELVITHLPLIYEHGKLIGHLDKNNPQVELLKNSNPVTLIFSGPQCYISPSIYTTTQLPTWNYIKVHITGTVNEIKNPETIKHSQDKKPQDMENAKTELIRANQESVKQFLDSVF